MSLPRRSTHPAGTHQSTCLQSKSPLSSSKALGNLGLSGQTGHKALCLPPGSAGLKGTKILQTLHEPKSIYYCRDLTVERT